MRDYGTSRDNIIIALNKKLSALKELKAKIKRNITDEQDANREYAEQVAIAQMTGKASFEYVLKDTAIQEAKHAESFKRMIQDIETEEARLAKEFESEKKKVEEERRKKYEEELRKQKEFIKQRGGVEQYEFAGRSATSSLGARRLKRGY